MKFIYFVLGCFLAGAALLLVAAGVGLPLLGASYGAVFLANYSSAGAISLVVVVLSLQYWLFVIKEVPVGKCWKPASFAFQRAFGECSR